MQIRYMAGSYLFSNVVIVDNYVIPPGKRRINDRNMKNNDKRMKNNDAKINIY